MLYRLPECERVCSGICRQRQSNLFERLRGTRFLLGRIENNGSDRGSLHTVVGQRTGHLFHRNGNRRTICLSVRRRCLFLWSHRPGSTYREPQRFPLTQVCVSGIHRRHVRLHECRPNATDRSLSDRRRLDRSRIHAERAERSGGRKRLRIGKGNFPHPGAPQTDPGIIIKLLSGGPLEREQKPGNLSCPAFSVENTRLELVTSCMPCKYTQP